MSKISSLDSSDKSYGFFARPGEIHGGESIKSQYS